MNRSFAIVMVPPLLVALGYVLVLRYMGYSPGYPRLIMAMTVFFGAIYWLSRKQKSKAATEDNQGAK
jgi:ABC-type spermidine/putrescine transport system permease subunit II